MKGGLGKNEYNIMKFFKLTAGTWIPTTKATGNLRMNGSQFRGSAKRLMRRGYLTNRKQGNTLHWKMTTVGMNWNKPKKLPKSDGAPRTKKVLMKSEKIILEWCIEHGSNKITEECIKEIQDTGDYKLKDTLRTYLASKKTIKKLKYNITYFDEKIKEHDAEMKESKKTGMDQITDFWSSSYYHENYVANLNGLREKKKVLEDRHKAKEKYYYDKYPPHNYGMDYPRIERAITDILINRGEIEDEDDPKLSDLMWTTHTTNESLDTKLSIHNWREDLMSDIAGGDYPELKGKKIPQLSYYYSMKKSILKHADELAEDYKKEHGIVFTPSEIKKIKKELYY